MIITDLKAGKLEMFYTKLFVLVKVGDEGANKFPSYPFHLNTYMALIN